MVSKRLIARNIIFSWGAQITVIVLGFFIAPFLVHRLGDTVYGLWTVIGALTGYFGILDFGTRTSVGRFIAFYRAKDDYDSINATANTALVLLSCVGLIAFLLMLGIQVVFFHIFEVSPEEISNARVSLLLVSINLALVFPLTLFDATLWAFQRFDAMNSINAMAAIMRAFLTFDLVGGQGGSGLIILALITLTMTILTGIAKFYMTLREEPQLRFHSRYWKIQEVRNILGYGIWRTLMSLGTIAAARVNPLVIGSYLGMALVTPYSLASRLIVYTHDVFLAVRAVLTPAATELHAQDTPDWQKKVMLQGGMFCSALALFFVTCFTCLGRPFFSLWIGPRLAYASDYLTILGLGTFLPLSQAVTCSILLGMARHKILGLLSVIQLIVFPILAIVLIWPFGITGACIAEALTATVCEGVIPLIFCCRVIHLPVRNYLASSMLFPNSILLLPSAGLFAAVGFHAPGNWFELFLYGICFSVCYGLVFCITLGLDGFLLLLPKAVKQMIRA